VARRCAYLPSTGRPCTRAGSGNPPLCEKHLEEILAEDDDDMLGELLDHPTVRGAFDRVTSRVVRSLDQIAPFIDRLTQGRPQSRAQSRPTAPRPRPGPRPRPEAPRTPPRASTPRPEDPRTILGFAPGARLDAAMIKNRRRELAQIFHPDHGGSPEAMKRVNLAVEALLAGLKK